MTPAIDSPDFMRGYSINTAYGGASWINTAYRDLNDCYAHRNTKLWALGVLVATYGPDRYSYDAKMLGVTLPPAKNTS